MSSNLPEKIRFSGPSSKLLSTNLITKILFSVYSDSFLLLLPFCTLLSLLGKFGSPYPSKVQQQPQEQRYPLLSMSGVFSCVQTMIWLQHLGF